MKKTNSDKPLTDKEWKALGKVMHGIEGLPKKAQKAVKMATRGRPPLKAPKKSISIRLDADIIDELRKHGRGWQTEVNDLLRASMEKGFWQ